MQKTQTCAALALLLVASAVLNAAVFPAVAQLSPESREISTFCGAGFSVAVALCAYFRPRLLRERLISWLLLALSGLSLVLLYCGIRTGNPALVAAGGPLGGSALLWFTVLEGVALSQLERADAMRLIPLAFVLNYACQLVMALGGPLPLETALAVYFIALFLSYVLIAPNVEERLARIAAHESPTVLDTTNPSSYLPFSSLIYITILMFNAACGFDAVRDSAPASLPETALGFLPVVLLLALAISRKSTLLSADSLEVGCTLLVVAVFLLIPITVMEGRISTALASAPSILLRGGTDCFAVLTYFIIASVGRRNPLGSLTTSASAVAASWVGIGCGAGATGLLQAAAGSSPVMLALTSAAAVFALLLYTLVALRGFSFNRAIQEVFPVEPCDAPSPADERKAPDEAEENIGPSANSPSLTDEKPREDPRFLQACADTARRYKLTNRETDVLELLARGRTGLVIQKRLVVSQNTVKSHVRHIYAKMGVHSQQELIDIVDREMAR